MFLLWWSVCSALLFVRFPFDLASSQWLERTQTPCWSLRSLQCFAKGSQYKYLPGYRHASANSLLTKSHISPSLQEVWPSGICPRVAWWWPGMEAEVTWGNPFRFSEKISQVGFPLDSTKLLTSGQRSLHQNLPNPKLIEMEWKNVKNGCRSIDQIV